MIGSSFVCVATLLLTIYGMLHSFVTHELVTNTEHTSSRLIMNRIMIFFERSFLSERYSPLSARAHLPDLRTMDGVLKVLALANVIELGLIIYTKTYREGVDEVEQLQFVAARLSARRLIAWMDQRFTLVGTDTDTAISVRDAQRLWLAEMSASLRAHVVAHREAFEDNVGSFTKFAKMLNVFTQNWDGAGLKALYSEAKGVSYAFPGEDFTVKDNIADDSVYGKRQKTSGLNELTTAQHRH